MIRPIRSILDRSLAEPAGCGFLAGREIEAWLDGQLPAPRREAFGLHHLGGCSSCALLAADLEVFHGVVTRGLIESERREYGRTQAIVMAHLRQKLEAQETSKERSFVFSWRWVASGIAAALLLVVGLPLLRDGGDGSTLVAGRRIAPLAFSAPPEVRGAESLVELWGQAGRAYSAADWSDAERLFGQIAEREPQAHDAWLYRGVALTLAGRHAEAVAVLERARRVAGEQGLAGTLDAYWLGVAWLADGDEAQARPLLERVRAAGGPQAALAAELLEPLE